MRAGPGVASSEVTATAQNPYPTPTALTALAASDPASAILLNWTAPNRTPDHYEVAYSVDSGTAWTDISEDIDGTTYTVTAGVSGKALSVLRYRVRAVYVIDAHNTQNSGWHEMNTAPVVSVQVTTPEAPNSLETTVGEDWVRLNWNAPASSGIGDITKYQYRQSSDGGTTWSPDWTDIGGSSDSTDNHTVTGLTSGTDYTFEVRAVSVFGPGTSSSQVTARPLGSDYAAEVLSARLEGNETQAWYVLIWKAPTATLDSQITVLNNYSHDNGANWHELSDIRDITFNGENVKTGRGPDFTRATLVTGSQVSVSIRAVESGPVSDTLTVRAVLPPKFADGATATREIAENTVASEPIGDPIEATGDGPLTYSLGGADGNSFNFDGSTGQLSTKDALNYEGKVSYSVTVTATDRFNESSSIDATINVTDEDEPPAAPSGLSVSQATLSTLTVTWTAPSTSDRPDVTAYKVQYRTPRNTGPWLDAAPPGVATTATLSNLRPGIEYGIQVQAVNDEGESSWASVAGTTQANTLPVINTASLIEVRENTTSVVTLSATDPDPGARQTWRLDGGADQSHFSLSGEVLSFTAGKDFENPDNADRNGRYAVRVHVTDDWEGSATKDLVVSLIDENEPPAAPGGLNVPQSTASSLTLAWVTPSASDRPAVTGYEVQYRTPRNTGAWLDATHSGLGTTATISSLTENTEYDLQVRAVNDEGAGDWASTVGTTVTNQAPAIQTNSGIDVIEGSLTVVTLTATDPDPGTTFRWELVGGADQSQFAIAHDVLTFIAEKDFENPGDTDGQNDYEVRVQVKDNLGATDSLDLIVSVTDENEPPGPVEDLIVSQATPSILTLTWTAPDTSDRPPVTSYEIQYRTPPDTGAWKNAVHSGLETTVMLHGLAASTQYEVWVRAVNDDGISAWTARKGTTLDSSAPTIVTLGPFVVDENQTHVARLKAASSQGDSLTWTITGGDDEDRFFLTKSGKLSFKGSKNFEAPDDDDQDGTYELTVEVSDGTTTAAADIQVQLQNVSEGPVISSPALLGVDEGETDVAVLEARDDEGDVLTWSIVGGDDESHFSLTTDADDNSGELSFKRAKDFGTPDDADFDSIYLLTVEVSDGTHRTQQELWVQLRDVNESSSSGGAPVITTLGPFNVDENQVEIAFLEATDTDSTLLTWSIAEGKDGDHFVLESGTDRSDRSELSFTSAKDFENPDDGDLDGIYSLTVEVDDGTHQAQANLLVRLQNVEEAPVVDNSDPINIGVGDDGSVLLVGQGDAGSTLDWSLVGGADEKYFTLDSNGELTFNPGPDGSRDADGDGIYELTVQVSDGKNTTVVTVQVQFQKAGSGEGADVSSEVQSPGASCGSITQASAPWNQGGGGPLGGGGGLPLGGVLLFLGLLLCPVLFVQWLRSVPDSD